MGESETPLRQLAMEIFLERLRMDDHMEAKDIFKNKQTARARVLAAESWAVAKEFFEAAPQAKGMPTPLKVP